MRNLSELLSSYIERRDSHVATVKSPLSVGSGIPTLSQMGEFDNIITDYANMLAHTLEVDGALSLAQWEALAELSASKLSRMRMRL